MIGLVESGECVPGLCVMAQISHGLGLTLVQFVARMEDAPAQVREASTTLD